MKCEEIREQLIAYLAGQATPEGRALVEEHLQSCAWCQEDAAMWSRLGHLPEEHPTPALRERVEALIAAYQEGLAEARVSRPGYWIPPRASGLAWALASLLVGVFAGHVLWPSGSDGGELAGLREEIRSMRQMVAVSLLQQSSASERLRGVNWSYRLEQPDPEVTSALIRTLKYDGSVDVRLAAVDALRRMARDPGTRQELVEALPRQDSPLVQMALIDLLAEVRERSAAEPLRRLREDAEVDDAVRQRAEWALRQLQ
jgi:hypothetical protein